MSDTTTIDPSDAQAVEPRQITGGTPSFGRRVLSSFAWQGGGQILGQLLSWSATLVVVRLLTPEDYGLMAMAMLFMGFLFMISELGIGSATVQAKEIEGEQLQAIFGVILATGCAGALLTFVAAPVIAAFFSEPRLVPLVRVLSINFFLTALISLPQAHAVRGLNFRLKATIDVLATSCGAIGSLALAYMGYGVWALVLGMLGQQAFKAVAYQRIFPIKLRPKFASRSIGALLRFGSLISLDRVVYFFYGNIDALIAARVLGKEALGVYTVALTLAATPLQRLIPTITQVSFAAFSRIQTESDRVHRNVLRAARLSSAVAFPILLGMASVAPVFVPLVLGEKWHEAVTPFQLICLVLPLRMLSAALSPALLGTGRAGTNLGNVVISFVLMAAAFAVGVRYGVLGLAAAWTVMYPLVFAITTVRTLRVLGMRFSELAVSVSPYAVTAVAMLLSVTLLNALVPEAVSAWTRLALLSASGAAFYISIVLYLDPHSIREVKSVFAG